MYGWLDVGVVYSYSVFEIMLLERERKDKEV